MGPTAAAAAEPHAVTGVSSSSSPSLALDSRFSSALHLPLPPGYTVTVESMPGLSVHLLILDALDGAVRLLPPWLRARVLEALGPEGRAAYYPMVAGTPSRAYPSFVVPTIGPGASWTKEARDQVADVRLAELDAEFGTDQILNPDAPYWRDAMRNPRLWLERVSAAFARVAKALEPIRAAHTGRLEVEEQRLSLMSEAQMVPHFIASTSNEVELGDHELRLNWTGDFTMPMQSSRVVLVPLFCSPDSEVLHTIGGLARGGAVGPLVFGYPVAGVHQWLDPSTRPLEPASVDRVETLLGAARARLFRTASPPSTMGALARSLGIAPSTASHHVSKLVESGLMASYQVGKEVWVARTSAGDHLLNLLD